MGVISLTFWNLVINDVLPMIMLLIRQECRQTISELVELVLAKIEHILFTRKFKFDKFRLLEGKLPGTYSGLKSFIAEEHRGEDKKKFKPSGSPAGYP